MAYKQRAEGDEGVRHRSCAGSTLHAVEQPRRGSQARECLACLRTSQGPWLQQRGEDRVVQLWGERDGGQGGYVGTAGPFNGFAFLSQ